MFPTTMELLERKGIIGATQADYGDLPVEILISAHAELKCQSLGLGLLRKTLTDSGVGTSMATQKAMAASRDPDALFRGLLESGEVSLDDVSKYEALFGYFPYAAWVARVTHIFFLGETPKVVTELMACLRGLQFVSPAGDLNMHAPYLELSTLLNKCAVQHASYNIRDVVLILAEQMEKVPEGKWPAFDALMDRVLRVRQPVRQSDTASPATLAEIMTPFREMANAEAIRRSLRTASLNAARAAPKGVYALTESAASAAASGAELGPYSGTANPAGPISGCRRRVGDLRLPDAHVGKKESPGRPGSSAAANWTSPTCSALRAGHGLPPIFSTAWGAPLVSECPCVGLTPTLASFPASDTALRRRLTSRGLTRTSIASKPYASAKQLTRALGARGP
jgi:hypothetical protein